MAAWFVVMLYRLHMRGNFDLRIRGVQSVHNQKMRAPDHIISKFLLDVAIRNHLPEVSWFIPSGLGMIFVRLLLISAVILSASTTFSAHAAKRVALVIGNSGYENVTRLPNPANDATAITAILKEAGFVVDTRRDLKTADMRRALRDFADTSRDADVAVVYYAGHGMEVDGTNYLIPVDAALERDLDVYDEAVPLERVLVTIEPAKQLRLVMLDACRDNPFARSMKRTNGTRAVGRGLAKVEPSSPNTLIAFASKAGSTAADGDGKNSPFTIALVKHIGTPGLDLRRAFGYVRDEVLKATGSRQEPYVYGSLGGDDVPLVPAKPVASQSTNPQAEVRRDYELAERVGTREVWTAFLAQYPDGLYSTLAKAQLTKLASEDARLPATEALAARPGPQDQTQPQKLAALSAASYDLSPSEVTTSLQSELRRVGCLNAAVTGDWDPTSQRALTLFNKHAGTNFDVKLTSPDILDAVKTKPGRVCPLVCEKGFLTNGDTCAKIACRPGYQINDDNECKKVREKKPAAAREEYRSTRDAERKETAPSKPQASGQIICTQQGCRPLRPGCRAVAPRSGSLSSQMEVCN